MEGESHFLALVELAKFYYRITAVLLGRLRLPVSEAITTFKSIWHQMAAGTTLAQKSVPGWKNKSANSKNLGLAFQKIVEENLEKSRLARLNFDPAHIDGFRDQFAMNSGLCRT